VHLSYDSSRASVVAQIFATHRDNATLEYSFNGLKQSSNTMKFTSGDKSPVSVAVFGSDGTKIEMDPIDLLWNAPSVHPKQESTGDYRKGQKGAIVEFFMW
jgi:alpha-amylase